jgi:hypothetical protein
MPEEVLVQALHQHAVRDPLPPLDPMGLDTRLSRADRVAALVKAAIVGGVVVALIAGLLILGNARRGDELHTADSIAVSSGNGTTPGKTHTKIVIGPNGERIVIEDDGDPDTVDSSTIVDDSSTTSSTSNTGGVTTSSSPSGDPNNPGLPISPNDPNSPNPTTGPTNPAPGNTSTTVGVIPGPTVAPTTATTAAPTTTAPPPTVCTGAMTPTSGTGSTHDVTIRGRATYANGLPVVNGTVKYVWGRTVVTSVTDIYGNFSKVLTLSTPNVGDTVTVRTHCYPPSPSTTPAGWFETTYKRVLLVRI